MRHRIIFLSCLLLFLNSEGQNLVPNPSFEIYSSCPTNENQVYLAVPWFNPSSICTPDFCHACYIGPSSVIVGVPSNTFGYQYARTGEGYADLAVFALGNVREYIEVKLLDSLVQDWNYCVTFYVSNPDSCRWATSRIGAYFSSDSIYSNNCFMFTYLPQVENPFSNIITDGTGWTKVSGVFTATGGERFMTIGNFYNDANTDTLTVGNYPLNFAYFYIDDVSVYELPEDSTNCFDGVGIEEIKKENEILVYPNPAGNELRIQNAELKIERIEIYDVLGQRVLSQKPTANRQQIIDVSSFPNGIYFLSIKNKEKIFSKKFVISR